MKIGILLISWIIFYFFSGFFFQEGLDVLSHTNYDTWLTFSSVIVLYPIINELIDSYRFKSFTFSFLSLFSIISFAYFILPLINFNEIDWYRSRDISYSLPIALRFIGFCYALMFMTIYFLIKRKKLDIYTIKLNPETISQLSQFKQLFNIIGVIYILKSLYPSVNNILISLQLYQFFVLAQYLLLFWFSYSVIYGSKLDKVVAIIWLVFFCLITIASTLLHGLIYPFILILFFAFQKNKKIPILFTIVYIIVFSNLLYLKKDVRKVIWAKNTSKTYNLAIWTKVINDKLLSSEKDYEYTEVLESQTNRVALIAVATFVIDKTPSDIPHWGFYSYSLMFSKFIPRAIWPGKPEERIGNYFGHYYGILDSDDKYTSWNMPQVVEAYVSFGWIGILVMPVIGYIIFLGLSLFYGDKSSFAWKIFGLSILMMSLKMDANFSVVYGNLLFFALAIYFLDKYLNNAN